MKSDKRFWASTRGRIILLLRGGNRSVNELATALELTTNAVRTHLDRLERDGLVRPSGKRPGLRKPTVTYTLAEEAEQLFPKAHASILHHLLDVLKERTTPKKLDEIVRAVGHRIAPNYRPVVQAGRKMERGDQVIAVLRELGGFCEAEKQNGKIVLRCSDCPLAPVVEGHPEVCKLVETLLADILGIAVEQHCCAEPSPQCVFEIDAAVVRSG
jgi:predicted ArsR family transcriptional regulator